MRTAIDLPDALVAEARHLAREHNTTLEDLIGAGLRTELDRLTAPGQDRPLQMRTFAGEGLRVGVEPGRLTELAYES